MDNIFQNGIYCGDLSISFLFNIPFRKCHILVVVVVAKFPLFCSDRRSESLSLNMDYICVSMCVCVSVNLQIRLGVIFIVMQVSWILGYFENIHYFIQPHQCFHSASMIYEFLLILGYQACTKSLHMYVANIDSYYIYFFHVLRSYVCRILGLYQVLAYVCRIY